MRIALINPPLSLEEMYGNLSKAGNTMPALGICYIAAIAQKQGHKVMIADAVACQLTAYQILKKILDFQPDLIGITATTIAIKSAAVLSELIKEKLPDIKIIIGGPHVTAVPEETFQKYPVFDIAVLSEGERIFEKLIRSDNIGEVPGIMYKDGDNYVFTDPGSYISDIDELPFPAFDLLPDFPHAYKPAAHTFQKLPAATLVTSRGCPMQCTFCDRSVFGNKFRFHSAEYVLEMLRTLKNKYGVREIIFYDDTFMVRKKRVVEICEGMLRENMNFSWSCFGRVDFVDLELLQLMKKSGCWQIGYGVESGSPKILDMMKKKTSPETIKKALAITKKAGIQSKGFFIIGNAGETLETIETTIQFAVDSKLDDFQITNLTPFPGSEIYATADKYGWFEPNWEKMNMLKITFVPTGLTKEILVKKQKEAYRRFYIRPKIIIYNLLRIVKNPTLFKRL